MALSVVREHTVAVIREACERWHYSEKPPAHPGRVFMVSVYEDQRWIGCLSFGFPTSTTQHKKYGVSRQEIFECTRIALDEHEHFVTEIMAATLKLLKLEYPQLKLLVSYADPDQGHTGAVYRSMSWAYMGLSTKSQRLVVDGEIMYRSSASHRFGSSDMKVLRKQGFDVHTIYGARKYLYAKGLTRKLRRIIKRMTANNA